ncbi:hypothetical protein GWK47_003447 [Chionoecetes opilio]|uniref:Uncharacterized protein n=1 Tax=Chionoecetes opilio TaxID=41210 RepID=A0A8J4YL08_CHIOP|nr:hypothetical protein GWK47_003447 [Chionoecetes opilio]
MASLLKKRRLPMAVLRIATLQGLVVQSLAPQEHMKQSAYFARKQTNSLTVQELVRENQSLKKQLKTLSRGDAQELQTKAAKQLRADIKTKAKDINQFWSPEIKSVKPDCRLPDCACLVNGLTCTDMCKLQTCTNQAV